MILLDDDLSTSKLANDAVRRPEQIFCGRPRSLSPSLPDYETSEAQHNPHHRSLSKNRADARFWRATCLALAIYVALTLIFLVPYVLVVSISLIYEISAQPDYRRSGPVRGAPA